MKQKVLVVNKASPLKEVKIARDIKGLKIGYVTDGRLSTFMDSNKDQVTFDAVYSPVGSSTEFEIARLKMADKLRIVRLPEDPQTGYVAFSQKSAQASALVTAYNAAVKAGKFNYDDFLRTEYAKTVK